MSTRGSPAPDATRARAAAERARRERPVAGDPGFAAVRRAETGGPALVVAPDGEPAFWLVPFVLDGSACGMARVSIDGARADVSTFGSGPGDRAAWPDAAFFLGPSESVLREIATQHPGRTWQTPRLSYDGSPHRWAWRLDLDGAPATTIFITPGSWRVRARPLDPGREA